MKLAGNTYTLRRVESAALRRMIKDDSLGYSDTETLEIGVLKCHSQRERRVLWHEAVHVFEDALEMDLTEAQVNMLAMLIDTAVQDNRELR